MATLGSERSADSGLAEPSGDATRFALSCWAQSDKSLGYGDWSPYKKNLVSALWPAFLLLGTQSSFCAPTARAALQQMTVMQQAVEHRSDGSGIAEPPVAKAMDYGQWQYENKKKQHDAKRKQHIIQVKELKFRPNTDDHDYDFKKNHAIRFLKEGNRVKAVVQFRGREIAHVDLGKKLLLRFAEDLTGIGTIEGQPRLEGRNAHVIISPVKAQPPAKEKPQKDHNPPQSAPPAGAPPA